MRKFMMIALAVLVACAAPPRPPLVAPALPAGPHVAWQVTGGRVEVLVYRAGPLAQLGHNHVLVSRQLQGEIRMRAPLTASSFALELPLASFIVDDPAARAAAGDDFAGEVPPADREATARNLLGPAVLDASRHPLLSVTAASLQGGPVSFVAPATIRLRDSGWPVQVPFSVQQSASGLRASGSFTVTHAALGLTPFSVAFGALRVAEAITVRFELQAAPAD